MAEEPTAMQMQQMQRQPRGLMGFLRDPRTLRSKLQEMLLDNKKWSNKTEQPNG
jgi:hypothetical protein